MEFYDQNGLLVTSPVPGSQLFDVNRQPVTVPPNPNLSSLLSPAPDAPKYFYQNGTPIQSPTPGMWAYDAQGNSVQVPAVNAERAAAVRAEAAANDGRDPFERRVPVYDNGRPVMEPGENGEPIQSFRTLSVTERLAELERRAGL